LKKGSLIRIINTNLSFLKDRICILENNDEPWYRVMEIGHGLKCPVFWTVYSGDIKYLHSIYLREEEYI
jgi:hypothetical protein